MPAAADLSALQRFERALARSVRDFAGRLVDERRPQARAAAALLTLLGISDVEAEDVLAGRLDDGARTRLRERLREEDRRLIRLARRASPAYDLNRHIAVRRLAESAEKSGGREPDRPLSGSDLNRRFARRPGRAQADAASAFSATSAG